MNSFQRHLNDRHCFSKDTRQQCRERLRGDREVYEAWEKVLLQMHCWMCSECMMLHVWRKSCKHNNVVIPGPYNGRYADYLISDIPKPAAVFRETPSLVENTLISLSLDLLNQVFLRHFITITSIPPPCRLTFSRTLKSCLDTILLNPREISSWIKLVLLPICTLNLYTPKNSSEECSGTKKKLQIECINQALSKWREPNGCINLITKLLELPNRNQVSKLKDKKMQGVANIQVCRKKLYNGNYTATIRVLSSDGIDPCNEVTISD